jgi:hypothetical protein
VLEPSVEIRHWFQNVYGTQSQGTAEVAHGQSSHLATLGLRARGRIGALTLYPSAGYTVTGSFATEDENGSPVSADLSGFRIALVVRATP